MQLKFHFYSDPGHAWLRVTAKDLADVGLTPDAFSAYSYKSAIAGGVFYLEEDCDADVFIKAYEAKAGRKPEFVEHYAQRPSRVRNYPGIHA